MTMNTLPKHLSITLTALLIAASLTACGDKAEKKTATQVAAKVGSEEISVHQINQVLSRTNTANATPETAKAMSREVLEKLIDQQLAVDQATEEKLNRTPEVVTQLEAARREILARAYLQKIAAAQPKPTPEELKKYLVEHPALFAERRVFNVQEIIVPKAPGVADQLRAHAAAGKTIEEAAEMLKSQGIKFQGGSATRAAEQIPLDLLPKIHALKDGQSLVLEAPRAVTLLRLASSQSMPIPEAAALPRIEQFISNQRATEAVAARIKHLRESSKIEYLGEFTAPGTAPASAAPDAPASSTVAPANADLTPSVIDKGVAGIK